jgi:predicted transcriptional regulator
MIQTEQIQRRIDPSVVSGILTLARLGISQEEILTDPLVADSFQPRSFMNRMISMGLIQLDGGRVFTTEKGFRFLHSYNSLLELCEGNIS